jgi:hypothetical protein
MTAPLKPIDPPQLHYSPAFAQGMIVPPGRPCTSAARTGLMTPAIFSTAVIGPMSS